MNRGLVLDFDCDHHGFVGRFVDLSLNQSCIDVEMADDLTTKWRALAWDNACS